MTYTDHIQCDTEGATIRYTLDDSDPAAATATTSVHEVAPGDPVYVNKIGTVTIRAVATKEGMEDSDEAQKTVTIQVGGGGGGESRRVWWCVIEVGESRRKRGGRQEVS